VENEAEAVGAEFHAYDHSFPMPADQMSALQQISMMVSVFTDAGIALDVVEEARHDPPDVVILDCLLLSAIDAAARAGLRTSGKSCPAGIKAPRAGEPEHDGVPRAGGLPSQDIAGSGRTAGRGGGDHRSRH
jgi:hypothetical protein